MKRPEVLLQAYWKFRFALQTNECPRGTVRLLKINISSATQLHCCSFQVKQSDSVCSLQIAQTALQECGQCFT